MSRIVLLAASCLLLPAFADDNTVRAGDGIERVEPPFWWQGFRNRELQLLVHGNGMSQYTPSVDYPGVDIARVERGDSPNYVFVYLDIGASAKPGRFDIVFGKEGSSVAHSYELRERAADASQVEGFSNADVIYMITPDRFANGDPANDSLDGYADKLDRSDDYGRHGGDLAGVSVHLDYIRDMGFTAVWLNPVLENAMPESSYHGYAITDLYEVDPRFGSNERYRALAEQMRAAGMDLIMDMVANHIGSGHWWMQDLPTADWLNFPQQRSITSNARTTNQDPYASAFDRRAHADGWFAETMPDLNQRNPLLADYLVQNTIWWIEYLGLAGIRMDTHPYPDKHYMAEWGRRVLEEYPGLNLTGEEWSANPAIVSYWQRGKNNPDGYQSYMPSMLDFPLQIALRKSLTEEVPWWDSPWTSAYEMLGNDFLYPDPARLVIFPDNHDMSRIYTQLDEDYDLYRMAMVYYLTMRGIPTLYYGTEVLMSHPGTDSHGAIREEFPGGWEDSDKNAFTGEGLDEREREAQQFLRKLLNWRRHKSVIHSGKLMQFTPIKDVYAYFRYDDNDTVMVVFNRGEHAASIETARFAERLGDAQDAVDVISGQSFAISETLALPPRSVLLLEIN
jgi:glycosidase